MGAHTSLDSAPTHTTSSHRTGLHPTVELHPQPMFSFLLQASQYDSSLNWMRKISNTKVKSDTWIGLMVYGSFKIVGFQLFAENLKSSCVSQTWRAHRVYGSQATAVLRSPTGPTGIFSPFPSFWPIFSYFSSPLPLPLLSSNPPPRPPAPIPC